MRCIRSSRKASAILRIGDKRKEKKMKYIKEVAIILVLVSMFPSIAASVTSYPIVCRGGGSLYFDYTPFSNFSQSPQIWITFKRASQKVGANWENAYALKPGQCAWLDRPVSNSEPDRIIVKNVKDFSISWTQGNVMGISSGLTYLNVLREANNIQSFDVYNDGQGNFIVTSVGASK